jgi:hypothetical protein
MAKNSIVTPYTSYPNTTQGTTGYQSQPPVSEWAAVTIATIESVGQVIKTLTEAINGKHGPLKSKAVYLRIKPGSTISVARSITGDYESAQVKEDGWDVDQAVIDSIEFVEVTENKFMDNQLSPPLVYISFKKVAVDDQNTNPADGFWFQLKDLEWKLS